MKKFHFKLLVASNIIFLFVCILKTVAKKDIPKKELPNFFRANKTSRTKDELEKDLYILQTVYKKILEKKHPEKANYMPFVYPENWSLFSLNEKIELLEKSIENQTVIAEILRHGYYTK